MMKYLLKCHKSTILQQYCHLYSIIAFKTIQKKHWMPTLAIDQGTSSTRAVLFDENLKATKNHSEMHQNAHTEGRMGRTGCK